MNGMWWRALLYKVMRSCSERPERVHKDTGIYIVPLTVYMYTRQSLCPTDESKSYRIPTSIEWPIHYGV